MPFNYDQDFKLINFREHPELYQVGRGEQGVLLIEPYKSEILPYWRFKTVVIAIESSEKIYELFLAYLDKNDFVGADMARKFLQMGFTRARRYANHASGKKYATNPQKITDSNLATEIRNNPNIQEKDWQFSEKAQAAQIFKDKWFLAKNNEKYKDLMRTHKLKYGGKD